MSVNEKMTALANEVRKFFGTEEKLGLDDLIDEATDMNYLLYSLITPVDTANRTFSYKNDQISSVKKYGFYECRTLNSIDLPNCVSIESNAFYSCNNLKNINLPKCRRCDDEAFFGASLEGDLSLPLVEIISPSAFGHNEITSIDLPKCIYIWGHAFVSNPLNTINAPLVQEIGKAAFYNTNLTAIELPECISIPSQAFSMCKELISVNLPKCTIIYDGEAAGCGAFNGCTSLTSIDLPVCTDIGYGAFDGCTSLTSIDLPVCTDIGADAFDGCTSLTSIDLPACATIRTCAFNGCTSLTSIDLPVCTDIGDGAFNGCTSLTSIDLPACTDIGVDAFGGCTSLTSINIPKVTKLDNIVFHNSGIASIYCPKVELIYGSTFKGCSNLTSLTLPQCISIGSNAFNDSALSELHLTNRERMCEIMYNTFSGSNFNNPDNVGSCFIYVHWEQIENYKADSQWSKYADFIEVDPATINIITFTVDGVSYNAISGMNWTQWCNSEYNTNNFSININTNYVKDSSGNNLMYPEGDYVYYDYNVGSGTAYITQAADDNEPQ